MNELKRTRVSIRGCPSANFWGGEKKQINGPWRTALEMTVYLRTRGPSTVLRSYQNLQVSPMNYGNRLLARLDIRFPPLWSAGGKQSHVLHDISSPRPSVARVLDRLAGARYFRV